MFSDVELYGKREGLRQYACLRPCKPYVKNVMQMRTLFLNQSSVKNFISHLIHTFRWSNPLIWYAAVVGWPNSHPNWCGVGILSSTPTHSAMHINLKKEKRNDFTEKRKHPTRLCHPSPTEYLLPIILILQFLLTCAEGSQRGYLKWNMWNLFYLEWVITFDKWNLKNYLVLFLKQLYSLTSHPILYMLGWFINP